MKCGDSADLLNMFFTSLFTLPRFNNFIKTVKIDSIYSITVTDYHPLNYRNDFRNSNICRDLLHRTSLLRICTPLCCECNFWLLRSEKI